MLPGWHREWTWISKRRHYAPTCSLARGGQVKGIFLLLDSETVDDSLHEFRARENPTTEETILDVPDLGAVTYLWTMGNNLMKFPEFNGLHGNPLAKALAARAKGIAEAGPDEISAVEYIQRVHEFDPDDTWTSQIVDFISSV